MPPPLLYHHARPLERVHAGVVRAAAFGGYAARADDDAHVRYFETGYEWLRESVGFQPLFLAVGATIADRRMTGYAAQFQRVVSWSPAGARLRRSGEFPNLVLFSWAAAPPGTVHMEFDAWCSVLNRIDTRSLAADGRLYPMEPVGPGIRRRLIKRSWPAHRWHRTARLEPHTVQAVAPALELASADELWCRNAVTRGRLVAMGFAPERVVVRRLPV